MKYAMMSIAFVFPVAFGFAENALIWYNLIAGIVCWVLSVYSFCKWQISIVQNVVNGVL